MRALGRTAIFGSAALGAGLLLMDTAGAWWYGDPMYRPYGSGALVYQRQTMMRGHGYTMQDLAGYLDGRRMFDRGEAVRLARELESGFGDNLLRNYAPGAVVAGSRTVPWTWRNFGLFQGYAKAAEQSSARLAEALAKEPTGQDIRQTGVWIPSHGMGRGPFGAQYSGLISLDAMREYDRLNATCYSCHMLFRGARR